MQHIVDGPWPQVVSVIFNPETDTSICFTEKFRTTSPTQIEVVMGIKQGLRVPTLAHEAVHAAHWVMAGYRWKDWAPYWVGIKAQKEETLAFVAEQVVRTGLLMAEKYSVALNNDFRHVSTWTYVSEKGLL
jgi:DNA-binding ferritin-like protein